MASSLYRMFCGRGMNVDDLVVPNSLIGIFTDRELNRYKIIFAYIDADGNGTIDAEELESVLNKFQIAVSPEKLSALFEEANGNKNDDGIDFGAFLEQMRKVRRKHGEIQGVFAQLSLKVGNKMAIRVEGDCCFVPRHPSGTAVYFINILGILFSMYWTYYIFAEGPERASFLTVVVITMDSLKVDGNMDVDSTRKGLGSQLASFLDILAPLYFLMMFLLPLTCCTGGPFEYLTVRWVQGLTAGLVLLLCVLEAIAQKVPNVELPFLVAYILVFLLGLSVIAMGTAAEHFRLDDRGGTDDDDPGGHFMLVERTPLSKKIRRFRISLETKVSQWIEQFSPAPEEDEEVEDTRLQALRRRLAKNNAPDPSDVEMGSRMASPARTGGTKKGEDAAARTSTTRSSADEMAAEIALNIASWRRNLSEDASAQSERAAVDSALSERAPWSRESEGPARRSSTPASPPFSGMMSPLGLSIVRRTEVRLSTPATSGGGTDV